MVGTCGWIAKGLASGSIKIDTGTTKSGKGGLWLQFENKSHCLAIFNEYDLRPRDIPDSAKFDVVCEDFCGTIPLTKAAEAYLNKAAQEWCNSANEIRESDAADMPRLVVSV